MQENILIIFSRPLTCENESFKQDVSSQCQAESESKNMRG